MKYLAVIILVTLLPRSVLGVTCTQAQQVTTPCTGILLPPQAALDALKCLQAALPTCQADLQACSAARIQDSLACTQHMDAEKAVNDDLTARLQRALALPPPQDTRAFWEKPGFAFGAGAVVGVASTFLTVYLVSKGLK